MSHLIKGLNSFCWNGLNCNVSGLTLQASIKCSFWIVKERGKEQHWHKLNSCILLHSRNGVIGIHELSKIKEQILTCKLGNKCMLVFESLTSSTKPKTCNLACKHAWRNLNLALNVAWSQIYWFLKSCIIFNVLELLTHYIYIYIYIYILLLNFHAPCLIKIFYNGTLICLKHHLSVLFYFAG